MSKAQTGLEWAGDVALSGNTSDRANGKGATNGTATAAVRLEGVSQRYGQGHGAVTAVDRVSLEIIEGEFVAIMGPSGSGKSTLLNLIGALDRATDGRVIVGGRDVGSLSPTEAARFRRREIGFVFQAFHLLPRLSALENVALPLVFENVAPAKRTKRARAALEDLGLGDRLDHRPTTLSGGEKQRVAIARALINRPRLLLADEPTGNLDSRNAADVVNLLAELNRTRGQTIIIVTHETEVAAAAERVIRMRDGRIIAID